MSASKTKTKGKPSSGSRIKQEDQNSAKDNIRFGGHKSQLVSESEALAPTVPSQRQEEPENDIKSADDNDEEAKEKLLQVLSGHLEHLPPLSSKIVRIFTSSTFTGKQAIISSSTFTGKQVIFTRCTFTRKQTIITSSTFTSKQTIFTSSTFKRKQAIITSSAFTGKLVIFISSTLTGKQVIFTSSTFTA